MHTNVDQNKLYCYGERWPSVHHARIRMGCSKLNGDLCRNLHVIPEPTCRCGYHIEDAEHFLLYCPLYNTDRADMVSSIINVTDITIENLLYGHGALTPEDNEEVFRAVHAFSSASKRFI